MAKVKTFIELDGPLFDPDVIAAFHDAVAEGLEELGEQGEGLLRGFISAGGFVKTGRFRDAPKSEMRRKPGESGYAKVGIPADSPAVWPRDDRPTRTWMERGYRSGVKLRKGVGGFRKTATALRKVDYNQFFADKISGALN